MRSSMKIGIVGALLSGLVLGGCSTPVRSQDEVALTTREDARSVVIRLGDGTGEVRWSEVVRDMASADVVLFGEMHGHALGTAVAQELWEDILVKNPKAVLSMEFYERDQQVDVDDYLSGVTNRKKFDKACGKTPKNNAPGHVRMIDAAKEAGRPVIAGNAPRRYVSMARKQGFDKLGELNAGQRALFEVPDEIAQGAYKDRFIDAMGGMASHGGEEMIKGFLRSQGVWDATMAQSIVDGLVEGSPVAHVVGFFHVQYGNKHGGSGLIDELRLRGDLQLNRELKIVSIITLARDDQELFQGTDAVIGEDGEEIEAADESDLGISTYVVYVGAHGE